MDWLFKAIASFKPIWLPQVGFFCKALCLRLEMVGESKNEGCF